MTDDNGKLTGHDVISAVNRITWPSSALTSDDDAIQALLSKAIAALSELSLGLSVVDARAQIASAEQVIERNSALIARLTGVEVES